MQKAKKYFNAYSNTCRTMRKILLKAFAVTKDTKECEKKKVGDKNINKTKRQMKTDGKK